MKLEKMNLFALDLQFVVETFLEIDHLQEKLLLQMESKDLLLPKQLLRPKISVNDMQGDVKDLSFF